MNCKKPKALGCEVLGRDTRSLSDAELAATAGGTKVVSARFTAGNLSVVVSADATSYNVTTILWK